MFDLSLSSKINSNNQRRYIMEQTKDLRPEINYNAFYFGIVVNSNDPERLGRVKVRIPCLHGTVPYEAIYLSDDDLPWARSGIFNAAGNDMGQFIVPPKGARVFVTFEYNNSSNPIYFGGIPTKIGKTKDYNDNPNIYDGKNVEVNTDDYITDLDNTAMQVLYKSLKGSTILINDKDGQESIKIIDASGQIIEMKNDTGNTLDRRGNKELTGTSGSSINIKTEGTINLDSNSLKHNGEEIGTATGDDKTFFYVQSTPAKEWEITHSLNKYPSVTIIDSANTKVEGEVEYVSMNKVKVKFSVAFSGKATLN
jgi:uncharacterized protein involved in type VI secretion and phage assembly